MRKLRLYEQASRGGGQIEYRWILDAPKRLQILLPNWQWVRGVGCAGCFVTDDEGEARKVAGAFGLRIESNGTHSVTFAPFRAVECGSGKGDE